jgi:translation initiation factor eIF-2B subunit beta
MFTAVTVTHNFIDPSLPLDRDSPSLRDDRATRPPLTSMFSLLSQPEPENSLPSTPGSLSPGGRLFSHGPTKDIRAEVLEGVKEIIDELGQVDDQIAAYALDHIHSNEIILTHTSSTTVQKFLLKAAAKRKFTVIHAESYPNNHDAVHATVSGAAINEDDNLGLEAFQKPLIEHGITVILIPDSAVFALMSRVNKVILGTHSVLANGGLIAAAGTRIIARAAKVHQTPVVVVSGVYKLSPVYPFDFDSLIEYGDPSKVLSYEDGDLVDQIDVQNPIYDYVPAELVDLYITNL